MVPYTVVTKQGNARDGNTDAQVGRACGSLAGCQAGSPGGRVLPSRRRAAWVVATLTGGVLLAAHAPPAAAVPPFARKYETSCMTCHVAPPKLNAFGRAFRNLGYRMPKGEEELAKQKKVRLGAPGWKRVWPKGIWPADIPGGTMVGFVIESSFRVRPNARIKSEFDGVEELGLLLGGTVGESFSYFGDVDLFEDGEPGEIGRLFVQYNKPDRLFNVRLGAFEPRAVPFSNHRRLIRQTGYLANVFPTIPAGNFFGFSPNQLGIEAWGGREGPGGKGGLLWAVGVVNGGFGGAADALRESDAVGDLIENLEKAGEASGGEFDVNSNKDIYVRLSYKLAGLGVFGSGTSATLTPTNNWRDDSLSIGAYLYRGVTGAFLEDSGGAEKFDRSGNTFYRAGGTVDWWVKDLNVLAGYQLNRDELDDGRNFDVNVFTVEGDYVTPWPWIQPAARFELVDPDFGPSFDRTTLSTTFVIRANVLLAVEGTFSRDRAPDLPPFENRARTQLRFIF